MSMLFQVVPQTVFTLPMGREIHPRDVVDVSAFDELVIEVQSLSPGTIPASELYLKVQTALEQLPEEGWPVATRKTLELSGGPSPQVWRFNWKRSDADPFLRLIRLSFENTGATDRTLDLRVVIFGIGGCGCGK